MKRLLFCLPLSLVCLLAAPMLAQSPAPAAKSATQQPGAKLTIAADRTLHPVSPTLYGMMTEEINYSYDGGLYPEMVRNRTMRDGGWMQEDWMVVQNAAGGATFVNDEKEGPTAALPNSIRLTVTAATATEPAGLRNNGYWGYPLEPNKSYRASLWAKADGTADLTASLVSDKTGKAVASTTFAGIGGAWKQYTGSLKTGVIPAGQAYHLELTLAKPGKVWLTLASVFPATFKGRPNGTRIDIMEKMAGLHPKFLRFPGGNYLEGDHISERYDWKKTIGPLQDRPTHPSPWGYHSSDGLGLLEFLEWCEDLNMDGVLGVYAGYSMKQEHADPGPALEPYVQDALDEIEYATGDVSTKWGAERAKDGHPAPFKISYVEIGNEDEFDQSKSYDGRYAQFYKAIKAKYPTLPLIATAPVTSIVPDVLDDHYYLTAESFFADSHHYDKADRKGPKIFVGEFATMEGSPTADFGAALGDAAWLTGIERNSDLIVMSAYAPMLVRVDPGGMQWHPNLIGYDGLHSYGSPSYYVISLFSGHLGDRVVDSSLTGGGSRFAYSVTRDNGKVYLKLVNGAPTAQTVEVAVTGATAGAGKAWTLHAASTVDTNSITEPKHIVPVEGAVAVTAGKLTQTVPGYSVEVIELPLK